MKDNQPTRGKMFIIDVIKKEEATGELKRLYKKIEHFFGFIPPHIELFGTIDPEVMREFSIYNQKMLAHPNIDKNLLPHLRLEIAKRECRTYCVVFNTNMLSQGEFEIDERQKLLMSKVLKALNETKSFGKKDLQELNAVAFTEKDFFDLLNYSTNFMAKSKMIEVYLEKES